MSRIERNRNKKESENSRRNRILLLSYIKKVYKLKLNFKSKHIEKQIQRLFVEPVICGIYKDHGFGSPPTGLYMVGDIDITTL